MNPVQQARALIAQGFRVVPTIDKVAPEGGFGSENPDATFGPEWFGEPGTQVGVLCGPCPALGSDWLLCVDVDGDPADSSPEMIAFLDLLPAHTLESHQGRHLFFRVAPEAAGQLGQWGLFKRPGRKHDGIDLKWAGGYACEAWDWAPGVDTARLAALVAPLPSTALEAILATREARPAPVRLACAALADPNSGPTLASAGIDPSQARADAIRWLNTTAPRDVADGAGGAACLVVAGALLVGFGLDDAMALELMIDVWAPLAWPGLDPEEEELARKIDEIDRLGSESFAPLELALLARTVRDGAVLTRPDEVAAALAALPASTPATSMAIIEENLLTWNAHLARTAKGDIKISAFNVRQTLDLHPSWAGLFGYDDFAKEVVYLRDPDGLDIPGAKAGCVFDEDNHVFALQAWLSHYVAETSTPAVIAAVHNEARKRTFHPVRNWLNALPPWDGTDRNLVTYLGAEPTPYHRAVCAKWLRSAVARAMVPGSKADTMLILEGPQGWRKSTAIRCLCPDTRWFYEAASRDVGGKDFMQDMRGKWLCEIPEVDQLIRSRDESELKAFLSRVTDNYRPSFGRKSHDFPRQLVTAGTTNHGSYLRDETGNRRYWAVLCGTAGPILDGAICDDRQQLWAQALAEYVGGQQWWLDAAEDIVARAEQEQRLEEDPWVEHLWMWLATRDDAEAFTINEALGGLPGAKPAADLNQSDLNRMSKVLRQMGLARDPQKMVGGVRVRKWRLPKL